MTCTECVDDVGDYTDADTDTDALCRAGRSAPMPEGWLICGRTRGMSRETPLSFSSANRNSKNIGLCKPKKEQASVPSASAQRWTKDRDVRPKFHVLTEL